MASAEREGSGQRGGRSSHWRTPANALTALRALSIPALAFAMTHGRGELALSIYLLAIATDFFDAVSSKRLFPLFAVGQSVGGAVGGALAVVLSRWLGSETLILAWALGLASAALQLRIARRPLRRWGPLALEEADESSAEGLLGALRYLRRSALARWLAVSVVGMVLALFVMQFIYLDIFERAFPSAEALATFFGVYLAISNLLEIVVELALTPWLIRRFGVAQANLVHPVLTLASFGALALDPRLYAAVLARANRELMESALAGEVRNLAYNALPFRFRGSMRAFLEGVLFYAAMSIAGIALLAAGERIDLRWLCAVGAAAALVYLAANSRVRGEYLRSMVEELRKGRLDLDEVSADLGTGEVARLAEIWDEGLRDAANTPPRAMLQLAPLLARRGFDRQLEQGMAHAHPQVRIACVDALASAQTAPALVSILRALDDPEPAVRLAGARGSGQGDGPTEMLRRRLRDALRDPDPGVRAEVALQLAAEGEPTLREMARSSDAAAAVEALERLPAALKRDAEARLEDADAALRAAALRCLARIESGASIPSAQLEAELGHEDARVRSAAAALLGARRDPESAPALARVLDDPVRAVREDAAEGLAALGDAGVRAAAPLADGRRPWTAEAALQTLAIEGSAEARRLLENAFRRRVYEVWHSLVSLSAVEVDSSLGAQALRAALGNLIARNLWLAFRILELLEDATIVRSVRRGLRVASVRGRADALEVLSHLGDRAGAQLLVLLHEDGPLEEKLPAVASEISAPRDTAGVLEEARSSEDRWLKMAAALYSRKGDEGPREEEATMESLLALRRVSLFAHLSLEQLEAIHQAMREAEYIVGEIVVREGDPGDELFVLLEGEVQAFRAYGTDRQTLLSTMKPVSYFGEIAVLDSAPRSATNVVSKDARLLALGGEHFRELILRFPELSFEVFRVLCGRIRDAEHRPA